MKTIILNGSPRKDWNTAQLLQSTRKGAESAGAAVEYFDLYDLSFTGCRSCLACKRKGIGEPCKCYYGDELEPIIDRIYKADRLILGSPIYFDTNYPDGEYVFMMSTLTENGDIRWFNNNTSTIVINYYNTPDDGDRWMITEAADFDPTEALEL